MHIYVNGEQRDYADNSTVNDVLGDLGLLGKRIAVELNKEILPYTQYPAQVLKPNDRLEVVHAIGGGQGDAFVIAGGGDQQRIEPVEIIQKHKNNRVLQLNRKGFAPSIRKQRYAIQPKDLVWIEGERKVTGGVHQLGRRVIVDKKSIALKNIQKAFHFGTFSNN